MCDMHSKCDSFGVSRSHRQQSNRNIRLEDRRHLDNWSKVARPRTKRPLIPCRHQLSTIRQDPTFNPRFKGRAQKQDHLTDSHRDPLVSNIKPAPVALVTLPFSPSEITERSTRGRLDDTIRNIKKAQQSDFYPRSLDLDSQISPE
jgi:hypothetical protein